MTYMQSNLAFAGVIQELSFNEIGFVSGGVIDSDEYDSPWSDAMLGKKSQDTVNWTKIGQQAIAGAVAGAAGGAAAGCVVGATATAGPGCVPAAVAGAVGGAVTGAVTELFNQAFAK
jgi:hypothetical protein